FPGPEEKIDPQLTFSIDSPVGFKPTAIAVGFFFVHIKQMAQAGHEVDLNTFELEAGPEKERLDEFLALRLPMLSLTRLRRALADHFLQTSGEPIRPGMIHRLDRDTSGAMVIAKTMRAHRIISKAFRQRRVVKRYLGLVSGRVRHDMGEIEAPIGRDASAWPR